MTRRVQATRQSQNVVDRISEKTSEMCKELFPTIQEALHEMVLGVRTATSAAALVSAFFGDEPRAHGTS